MELPYLSIYSIFNLNKFINKNNFITVINSIINKYNIFGLFITIYRSQKLKTYPHDIHGCLGYWDNNYNNITDINFLYNKIISLSIDTAYKDSRRTYFKYPLILDSNSILKISFMLNPIYKINSNTGIFNTSHFNNKDYGLIIDNGYNKATYLPGVFSDISWSEIKESIKSKANINNLNNNVYYAYKTLEFEQVFINILNKYFFNVLISSIYNFFKINFYFSETFIPYSVNKDIIVDKSQDIRNIASLNDLITLNDLYLTFHKNKINNIQVKNNLQYYINKHKKLSLQALSFLLLCLYRLNINTDIQGLIIKKLILNINNLEEQFELGEILSSLSCVLNDKSILYKKQLEMYNKLNTQKENNEDIFKYNWQSQFLLELYINNKNKNNNIIKHAKLLSSKLCKFIKINQIDDMETNYLAVLFEMSCSLFYILNDKSIKDYIFMLLIKLCSRQNNNGLFMFSDKTMRIDITGHIIHGLNIYLHLIKSKHRYLI